MSGPVGAIQFSDGAGNLTYDPSFIFVNNPAVQATGTITTTTDSPVVAGIGTLFTTQLKKGELLITANFETIGTILNISSDFSLNLTGNASNVVTNSAFNTSAYNSLTIDADFLPNASNKYNLGSTGAQWRELFVGPGSINITGQTGSSQLGIDDAGIAYFKSGLSVPFLNVGPTIATTGAVGGWLIDASGDPLSANYDLFARQNTITPPYEQFGPSYSLINKNGITGYTGPLGPTGYTGYTGPVGPSISWVGGDTGPYNATATNTINTSATRMNEHTFTVTSTHDIFLIHYNLVLKGGVVNNTHITTTLGVAASAGALATSSTNLYDLSSSVVLTGYNTDSYIAGANPQASDDICNINGYSTATGLTVGLNYSTVWAAVKTSSLTLTNPKINQVVLKIG